MGYRRGYYKKDGTYVQGHYTKSRSNLKPSKKNKGCASILGIFLAFSLTMYLINQL